MTTPDNSLTATVDPLTAFGMANRKAFGLLLIIVGLLIGLVGGYACSKGYALSKPPETKEKDKDAPPQDAAAKKEVSGNPTEWYVGGTIGIVAGLIAAAFGLIQITAEPNSNPVALRGDIRMTILLVGGSIGLLLMLFGGALFGLRLDALTDWLLRGRPKGMLPVVSALAVSLVGLLIAYLAILPARGEDRVNPTARRLVYGANAVLSSVVLLSVLVGVNALINVKLPVKLDTTSSGFYTLDPKTVEYLQNLQQPVTLYSTVGPLAESQALIADIERLLVNVEQANPAKVTLKNLSPTTDANEINALVAKHPTLPIKQKNGVLITVGTDERKAAFLSAQDFFNQTAQDQLVFEGEGRLVRELLFLADNAKTVIYVTQGSGELSLTPNQRSPERSISKLVEKLKQVNCDVRPLVIDAKNPAVPGDASLVLIADPISSLPKPVVEAIGIYVLPGDKQSKRGKFILLSGPNPSQDGKSIQTIGFEPQLTSLGIALGKEQIFSDPDRNNMTAMPVVGPSPESNSPIAKEMQGQAVRFFTTRGVEILQGGPPDAQVEPLFVTLAGRRTFVDEPDLRGSSALATWLEIQDNPKVRTAKQYGDQPRIVGVTVKDGKSTQGVVVGSGMAFCDVLNGALNEIFISFIDTLRERPSVSSLATKQYGLYTPPPLENYSRAFWLPVLLIPLTLAAIGAGVWVVRRR